MVLLPQLEAEGIPLWAVGVRLFAQLPLLQ
jgi:hypothetical protein